MFLNWIYWNPSIKAFTIPWLSHDVVWYGVLFALGILLSYFVMARLVFRLFLWSPQITLSDLNRLEEKFDFSKSLEAFKEVIFLKSQKQGLDKKKSLYKKAFNRLISKESSIVDQKLRPFEVRCLSKLGSKCYIQRAKQRLWLEKLVPSIQTLQQKSYECMDKLCLYLMICMVIFSRVFHFVFYENVTYLFSDPLSIFKVWEGGLSSHGGVVGLFIGMGIFLLREGKKYRVFSFFTLLDLLVIPGMLTGGFIRIGNFINQEILGKPTDLPWGVVFGASSFAQNNIALHPVVLYEAIIYFVAFFIFSKYFSKWIYVRGKLSGLCFSIVFSARFFLEFLKQNQSYYVTSARWINMGQLLTVPLMGLGFFLLYQSFKSSKTLFMGNRW